MRKFLILCLVILILSGCTQNANSESSGTDKETPSSLSDTPPVNTETEEKRSYDSSLFLWDTPPEFKEYLYSNQIDIDMEREENESGMYKTSDINNFCVKYYDIWNNEMNIVYENLIEQLSGEAKSKLEKSQEAWVTEEQYSSSLWYDIFELSKGYGTGDAAMVCLQRVDRIRKRTFLLAEYQYWLTGDFVFSYPNSGQY